MSTLSAIHQFVAGFTSGDAISNEARVMRKIFRSWGYESHIFSEAGRISPVLQQEIRDVDQVVQTLRPGDIVLLHLSIGSRVNDLFATLPCRKAILYHNMTPADYLRGIQEQTARKLTWGREQVCALAGSASLVMADSRFNADELKNVGYSEIRVLPLLLDFASIRARPDRKVLRTLRDGKVNVLFVGRSVPNKRLEDVLSAFYYFQKFVEPNSRFIHVGSHAGMERYQMMLQTLVRKLDLENVLFPGTVSQEELSAYYQGAHLFLCMSEHEGFCIPLIESMVHDVPILAYAAAAVPETLDGAGVLFREKQFDVIAEMMGQVVRNKPFREALVRAQRIRLSRFEQRKLESELKACLTPMMLVASRLFPQRSAEKCAPAAH